MRYKYDAYGWFVEAIDTNEVLQNTSSIPPPEPADGKLPNYIGNSWMLLEYVTPNQVDIETYIPPIVSRKLTHLEFRERFTHTEQEWADELEATFESNPMFTDEQKRMLRTGYKNFNLATEVDLDDPRIPPMLMLYVALGGLTPNRPSEILL